MNGETERQFTDAFPFQFDTQQTLLGRDTDSSIAASRGAAHARRGGKARDGEAFAFGSGNIRGEAVLELAFLVQN